MKPGAKKKSQKKSAGRRGKKSKARERKALAAVRTVSDNGTLTDWVAGMEAMGEKPSIAETRLPIGCPDAS